jgi:hypothetical protein
MDEITALWICTLILFVNQIVMTYDIWSFIYRYTPPAIEEDIELHEIYIQMM